MRIAERLAAPSPGHPFGTDSYGRDGLSLVMAGARTALAVALAACAIGLGIGVPLGLLAAARGGWVDEAVMRLNDLVFGFPALLLAVLLAATLGPGALDAVIAIGVYSTPVFARVVRAGARRIWRLDYILAARVAGEGPLATAPWLAAFPGGAILVTVLGFSLLGEGLRVRFAEPGGAGG